MTKKVRDEIINRAIHFIVTRTRRDEDSIKKGAFIIADLQKIKAQKSLN